MHFIYDFVSCMLCKRVQWYDDDDTDITLLACMVTSDVTSKLGIIKHPSSELKVKNYVWSAVCCQLFPGRSFTACLVLQGMGATRCND